VMKRKAGCVSAPEKEPGAPCAETNDAEVETLLSKKQKTHDSDPKEAETKEISGHQEEKDKEKDRSVTPHNLNQKKYLDGAIITQLKRLSCTLSSEGPALPSSTSTTSSSSQSSATTSTIRLSRESSFSFLQTKMDGIDVPRPLLQWMAGIQWPRACLFEHKDMSLLNVELRSGWQLKGDCACPFRPALEIGSANDSSNATLFLAIPLDSADPSLPDLIIKRIDQSITLEDQGIPLLEFLSGLEADVSLSRDVEVSKPSNDKCDALYTGFLQALAKGDDLPEEEESDNEHDAEKDEEDDAGDEDYEWSEAGSDDEDDDEEEGDEDDNDEEEEGGKD